MPDIAYMQPTLLHPNPYHSYLDYLHALVAPQAAGYETTTKHWGDLRLRDLRRKAVFKDDTTEDEANKYRSPDYAPFVREILICRSNLFALEAVEPTIAELTSVDELSLVCPYIYPMQRLRLDTWYLCFATQTRQLTSLTLDGLAFRTFSDLTYILKSCPALKALALRNLVWPGITGPESVVCEESMQPEPVTDGNGLEGGMSYKHKRFANAENWKARLAALHIDCNLGRATDVIANWLFHSCRMAALEIAHLKVGCEEDSLPGVEVEAESESDDPPGHSDLLLASQTTLRDLTLHATCDTVTDWKDIISFYDGFLSHNNKFTSLQNFRIVGVLADSSENPAVISAGLRASMTALLAIGVEVSVDVKWPEP